MTFPELVERVGREEGRALEGSAQWQVVLMATAGKLCQLRAACTCPYSSPYSRVGSEWGTGI